MMCRMDRPAQTGVPITDADRPSSQPRPRPAVPDLASALADAQSGDSGAFRALYRDIQPRLLRYLRALVGDDAEDVASEAWLQVARDLHRFHGDYDGFRGWVATIARHRAVDHLRRHSRRPPTTPVPVDELTDLTAPDDTEARAMDAVSTDAAVRLIATLPPDQAEAVLLRVVVGLDAESAGKVLGKRAGAVRTAAYRGLRTLASRLEQAGDHPRPGPLGTGPLGTGPPLPRGRLRE
jgi:RNA polymerase sigma-70 factor, ECF subfamily